MLKGCVSSWPALSKLLIDQLEIQTNKVSNLLHQFFYFFHFPSLC
jgi:hypothetical protein